MTTPAEPIDDAAAAGHDGGEDGGDPTQTLLVLGATGDLTARLLLPGLAGLLNQRDLRLALVGSGRHDWDDDRWRDRVSESFATTGPQTSRLAAVAGTARYVRADATEPDDLRRVLAVCRAPLVVYFALPPEVTLRACRALAELEVPEGTRLVLEKPFGSGADSAEELNRLVTRLVPENQVYRVDHYLGMSTVLNILGLRFTNRVLESVLDNTHVESVDVVLDESLALEGRASYYDRAGALVDMIQSHALHVLSFLAMEPPSSIRARDLRDATAAVLRATRVWDDDPVSHSRRARYTAGTAGGRPVPAYADEPGVDPARGTETLAEVVVEVNTWRWAGVPFRLRAAKARSALDKRVTITFRQPSWVPEGLFGHESPDRVHIGLDPEELRVDFNVTGPGDPRGVNRVGVAASFGTGDLPPYGQVLAGVLDGDPTLSVRGDHAVETWRIVEPVIRAWRTGAVPLEEYTAGTGEPPSLPGGSSG